MWSDRPRCSQGAALVRLTVSGTKKCPEEPRLRVDQTNPRTGRVVRYSLPLRARTTLGLADPARNGRYPQGSRFRGRDTGPSPQLPALPSRRRNPLTPANSTRVLLGQAALAPLEVLDPKRKDCLLYTSPSPRDRTRS